MPLPPFKRLRSLLSLALDLTESFPDTVVDDAIPSESQPHAQPPVPFDNGVDITGDFEKDAQPKTPEPIPCADTDDDGDNSLWDPVAMKEFVEGVQISAACMLGESQPSKFNSEWRAATDQLIIEATSILSMLDNADPESTPLDIEGFRKRWADIKQMKAGAIL